MPQSSKSSKYESIEEEVEEDHRDTVDVSFFVCDRRCGKTSGHFIPFCLFLILCLSVLFLSFRGGAGDVDSIGRVYVDFFVNFVSPFLFNVYANCCKDFFCDVLALASALNSDELICLKFIYIRSNYPCPQLLFIFLALEISTRYM